MRHSDLNTAVEEIPFCVALKLGHRTEKCRRLCDVACVYIAADTGIKLVAAVASAVVAAVSALGASRGGACGALLLYLVVGGIDLLHLLVCKL